MDDVSFALKWQDKLKQEEIMLKQEQVRQRRRRQRQEYLTSKSRCDKILPMLIKREEKHFAILKKVIDKDAMNAMRKEERLENARARRRAASSQTADA